MGNESSPAEVLELVERGKSRGLLDLIAGNLDVRIRLRSESDRPLVTELEKLRTSRNDLVNRLAYWNSTAALSLAGEVKIKATEENKWEELQAEVKQVEKGIGELVERLQYRNATYTEDPALHLYKENQVNEYLEADTALVEYYIYRNQVLALVNTGKDLVLEKSICNLNVIQRGLVSFSNNLAMIAKDIGMGQTKEERRFNTTRSSITCLNQLYDCLIKPLEPSAFGCFSDTPALNAKLITVAATGTEPTKYAWFSNQSYLAAPGLDVLIDLGRNIAALKKEGDKTKPADIVNCRRFKWSGTSFAAPLVAGAAALLISANVETRYVKTILWETATKPTDWNGIRELNLDAALSTI